MQSLTATVSLPETTYVQPELAAKILHLALLEIRQLTHEGKPEQAAALADAVHNIPALLLGGHIEQQRLHVDLATYQTRYAGALLYDYTALLEADPAELRAWE